MYERTIQQALFGHGLLRLLLQVFAGDHRAPRLVSCHGLFDLWLSCAPPPWVFTFECRSSMIIDGYFLSFITIVILFCHSIMKTCRYRVIEGNLSMIAQKKEKEIRNDAWTIFSSLDDFCSWLGNQILTTGFFAEGFCYHFHRQKIWNLHSGLRSRHKAKQKMWRKIYTSSNQGGSKLKGRLR